jgi:hypothetical protein
MTTEAWVAEQNARQPMREYYFDLVANPADWKAPIDAVVPIKTDLAMLVDAIEWFTATKPTITYAGADGFHVAAIGYRAGPAGAQARPLRAEFRPWTERPHARIRHDGRVRVGVRHG